MPRARRVPVALAIAVLVLTVPVAADAQTRDETRPFVIRGRQTEGRQKVWHERMQRLYESLKTRFETDAPELLPSLEPPPTTTNYGYQLLPKLGRDPAPPAPGTMSKLVSYYWAWSDRLIANETTSLERMESDLATLAPASPRAAYEKLAGDYRTLVTRRGPIDSDVQYNWLWQTSIDTNRGLYDRLNAVQALVIERQSIDVALASGDDATIRAAAAARGLDTTPMVPDLREILIGRSESLAWDIAAATRTVTPPGFLRLEHPTPTTHVLSMKIYTDIADAAFVDAFKSAVESAWRVRDGAEQYEVRLDVTRITPEQLYCPNPQSPVPNPRCVPPTKGAQIDLDAHAARFPRDGLGLTTGARSLRLVGGALALAPFEIAPRVLAHEFGHVLGFPDTYRRGYRDMGAEGYAITELADQGDIMGMPATGPVLARHFTEIVAAVDVQERLTAGLTALYQRDDATTAIARFREVLDRRPGHYGATFQLAKALDEAGRRDEALPIWKSVLAAAESINDGETLKTAKERVASDW